MNEETFARLLQQREGETLDFKQELPGSSDLAVLISAFYNTRGGTIIIGVDDQRRPVGVDRPQGVEAGIVNIIRDRLDLDVLPTIEIVTYQDREFVVVTCPRGPYPPYFVRGEHRPYVRVGSSNRVATHAEIRHLYLLSGEVSYEILPCRGATLADLSPALIARYRERRSRHTAGALDLSARNCCATWAAWLKTKAGFYPPAPECCSSAKTPTASCAKTRSLVRSSKAPTCCASLTAKTCEGRYSTW